MTSQSDSALPGVELPDGVLDVVSHNPLPVLILEVPSERVVAASPAAQALFSPDNSDLVGRNVGSFTADAPISAFELLSEGRLIGFERVRQFRVSDGSVVPLQAWVRAMAGEAPLRHVFVVLSAVGARTKDVGFSLPVGLNALIGTTDVNLRIERVHSDVDAIVGNEPEELVGETLFGIVDPDDLAGLMWALAQSIATGKGVALHVHVNSATGHTHLCEMLLLPVDPPPSFAFTLILAEHSRGLSDSDVEPSLGEARGIDVLGISRELADLTEAQVPGISELSSREFDVITRLLAGYRVPAIARILFVSQSTVRNHLSSVFKKLGVESQQELIDLLVLRKDETSSGK
jgi:DNA-binding CsgD family transcriptional regulator